MESCSAMVTGIVVTHGNIATELLGAAESVYGKFSKVTAFSNSGKSPTELRTELENALEAAGGGEVMIFVDFMGGSCSHACLSVAAERAGTCVVSGVNLPMLLAFLNKRGELPLEQLAAAILERSHNSIRVVDPRNL